VKLKVEVAEVGGPAASSPVVVEPYVVVVVVKGDEDHFVRLAPTAERLVSASRQWLKARFGEEVLSKLRRSPSLCVSCDGLAVGPKQSEEDLLNHLQPYSR